MENKMFCFQCEQTACSKACTGNAGICGKTAFTAELQDRLTGALIGLARASLDNDITPEAEDIMLEGLFATLTNVNFDNASIQRMIGRVHQIKAEMSRGCAVCKAPCSRTEDYDLSEIWNAPEDIRSLKSIVLFGLRGMAAYAFHAKALGYSDKSVSGFIFEGMCKLGYELPEDKLLELALRLGEINLRCMELLDRANTECYGIPSPAEVSMTVEKGPFIVVTGHDLYDLKQLLEQAEGRGVNVYTHGEMLPAHGYPELRKYSCLKGNIGTAWQNQGREFSGLPAPVVYTSNCLMPPSEELAERIFTSGAVSFPGVPHIENGDFEPVIQMALEMKGFTDNVAFSGINGGTKLVTGFGHGTVLSSAEKIISAVKSGDISRFFLVAGCDGGKQKRSYYTEFVKAAPKDSVILTLACGKFRFNDLDMGNIGGIPRLLDMGQCNDAFGAIKVAAALADAFECNVNELPLSMVLSWYEQKAVCILLTLLHLGIKNILLGPSLPAFISPNVLDILVKNYSIGLISTPEEDLKRLCKK